MRSPSRDSPAALALTFELGPFVAFELCVILSITRSKSIEAQQQVLPRRGVSLHKSVSRRFETFLFAWIAARSTPLAIASSCVRGPLRMAGKVHPCPPRLSANRISRLSRCCALLYSLPDRYYRGAL